VIDGITTAPARADNFYPCTRIVVLAHFNHSSTSAACAQSGRCPSK
jgi:hypothetical protein